MATECMLAMGWGRQVDRSHRRPGVTLVTEDPQQLPHGLAANGAAGMRAPADGCTQGTVHVPGTVGAPRVVTPKWIFERICRGTRAAEPEAPASEAGAAASSSAPGGGGEVEAREDDAASVAGSEDSDEASEEY